MILVVVRTLGDTAPLQTSVNTGAVNTGTAGHSILASAPWDVVTAGAVVSTTRIFWVHWEVLRQVSVT